MDQALLRTTPTPRREVYSAREFWRVLTMGSTRQYNEIAYEKDLPLIKSVDIEQEPEDYFHDPEGRFSLDIYHGELLLEGEQEEDAHDFYFLVVDVKQEEPDNRFLADYNKIEKKMIDERGNSLVVSIGDLRYPEIDFYNFSWKTMTEVADRLMRQENLVWKSIVFRYEPILIRLANDILFRIASYIFPGKSTIKIHFTFHPEEATVAVLVRLVKSIITPPDPP